VQQTRAGTGFPGNWGATQVEIAMPLPGDGRLAVADVLHRAVDVEAPPAVVFRWLCQLRVAPYSYDWIDNLGRRSPRELVAGLDSLAIGQRFMTIFELVDFEPGRQLTLATRPRAWPVGAVVVTYVALARGPAASRLLVRLRVRHRGRPVMASLLARALPWGDLVMMRRQLLTLRELAERDARKLSPRTRIGAADGVTSTA